MLKKIIEYDNLDGERVAKEFHFNLSKTDLAEYAMTSEDGGGLEVELRKMQSSDNPTQIFSVFKKILSLAVGVRVGDRFLKTDEIRSSFFDTGAYSEMFLSLVKDPEALITFILL